ncbi:MAG TPA: hypothetical protein VN873_20235 [Candidatus Angelobacter sp.]|nr:hypothetical protein [Candidatus Angelobacter sp.]
MKTTLICAAALGLGFALVAQTTLQPQPADVPALSGNNTNGPTEITSEQGQFFLKSNVFVYRGNVHVDNPQMKLTCGLLTVEAPTVDVGRFNRATAETNVVINWWDEKGLNHATSDKAVYTYTLTNIAEPPKEDWQTNAIVVLTGHPVVTNSQIVYRSDPLVWDRIHDVITSTNFLDMKIIQNQTNRPSLFDAGTPKSSPSAK